MNSMFSRSAALLGEEQLKKLQSKKVAVFGIGGVGSYVFEALLRTGVKNIDVFDSDTVEISNLNRQIIATQSTLGMDKTAAAAVRAKEINADAEIGEFKLFYSSDTADSVDLSVYDYIVDAIDSVSSKTELIIRAQRLGVPIISSMGTGNKLDPTKIEVADIYKTHGCPLARVMRQNLKKQGVKKLKVVFSSEEPINTNSTDTKSDGKKAPASCMFVPAAAGLAIAAQVVRDLIK